MVAFADEENVVRHGIPSIMDADEQQQQGSGGNAEQGVAFVRAGGVSRDSEQRVCG